MVYFEVIVVIASLVMVHENKNLPWCSCNVKAYDLDANFCKTMRRNERHLRCSSYSNPICK